MRGILHRPDCTSSPPGLNGERRQVLRCASMVGGAYLTGAWAAQPALAQDTGDKAVVLSLSGRVRGAGAAGRVDFDMASLAALAQHGFSTRTPWFDRPRHFSGPLLRDVLAAAGARGKTLRLWALNDYRIDIPFSDTQRHDVLLARLLDGQPMRVRDKGPLFVIYPFDHDPELRNVVFYSRSAWQLRTIEVL